MWILFESITIKIKLYECVKSLYLVLLIWLKRSEKGQKGKLFSLHFLFNYSKALTDKVRKGDVH